MHATRSQKRKGMQPKKTQKQEGRKITMVLDKDPRSTH